MAVDDEDEEDNGAAAAAAVVVPPSGQRRRVLASSGDESEGLPPEREEHETKRSPAYAVRERRRKAGGMDAATREELERLAGSARKARRGLRRLGPDAGPPGAAAPAPEDEVEGDGERLGVAAELHAGLRRGGLLLDEEEEEARSSVKAAGFKLWCRCGSCMPQGPGTSEERERDEQEAELDEVAAAHQEEEEENDDEGGFVVPDDAPIDREGAATRARRQFTGREAAALADIPGDQGKGPITRASSSWLRARGSNPRPSPPPGRALRSPEGRHIAWLEWLVICVVDPAAPWAYSEEDLAGPRAASRAVARAIEGVKEG